MQVEPAGDRAEDDDARHVREDGRAELDLTRERYDGAHSSCFPRFRIKVSYQANLDE